MSAFGLSGEDGHAGGDERVTCDPQNRSNRSVGIMVAGSNPFHTPPQNTFAAAFTSSSDGMPGCPSAASAAARICAPNTRACNGESVYARPAVEPAGNPVLTPRVMTCASSPMLIRSPSAETSIE